MLTKLKCLDLFSGLGGFSEAFVESDKWEVLRIDNDEQFSDIPHTHIADLTKLDIDFFRKKGFYKPDILLMSPPCECFSLMSVYHYWENGRPKKDATRQAIALVQKTISLKNLLQPKSDVLENPNGMMRRVLGKPNHYTWWGSWYSERDIIMLKLKKLGLSLPPMKPTSLWGLLPDIKWRPRPKKGTYQEAKRGAKSGIQNSQLRPEERSCIPFEFSLALKDAIEENSVYQSVLGGL